MRAFAVVTIADVQPLVNAAGQAVIDRATKSLDGTQMIICLNHPRQSMDGIFNDGVDVDALLAGLTLLNEKQVTEIAFSPDWYQEVEI